MILGVTEKALLRTPAIVEQHHGFGRFGFVCHNDLVIVLKINGFKKVQLYRSLALLLVFSAGENEAKAGIPAFGFPLSLKK